MVKVGRLHKISLVHYDQVGHPNLQTTKVRKSVGSTEVWNASIQPHGIDTIQLSWVECPDALYATNTHILTD